MSKRLRLSVIACASLRPELELLAPEASNDVTVRHLEMGLHQRSAAVLNAALQAAIDAAEGDAIAVAYGLCNRGIVGLKARRVPVAIPRAHDCLALLLGGRRYLDELNARPGTYFQSAGWLDNPPARQPDFTFGPNSNVTRERLVERYGEENAEYLMGQFEGFTRHYDRLAYIATLPSSSAQRETEARDIAAKSGWEFARLEGDLGRLKRLLDGQWDEREFLTLRPGERVLETFDQRLIAAEPA